MANGTIPGEGGNRQEQILARLRTAAKKNPRIKGMVEEIFGTRALDTGQATGGVFGRSVIGRPGPVGRSDVQTSAIDPGATLGTGARPFTPGSTVAPHLGPYVNRQGAGTLGADLGEAAETQFQREVLEALERRRSQGFEADMLQLVLGGGAALGGFQPLQALREQDQQRTAEARSLLRRGDELDEFEKDRLLLGLRGLSGMERVEALDRVYGR